MCQEGNPSDQTLHFILTCIRLVRKYVIYYTVIKYRPKGIYGYCSKSIINRSCIFLIGAITLLYMLCSIVKIWMEGECVTDEEFWYIFKVKVSFIYS